MLEDNTGVSRLMVRTALECWGSYPEEVDALVGYAERAEAERSAVADRAASLLHP